MNNYLTNAVSPVPQSEQESPAQVKNSAGGYSFTVTPQAQALRFLILGSEGGSYYASERKLTVENAKVIIALASDAVQGPALVETILDVSLKGRAPKVNTTLFALAICARSPIDSVRLAAYAAIPQVCRTATHLYDFCNYIESLRDLPSGFKRGWSAGLRRAVAQFYVGENKTATSVAYQAVKYRQRNGWTHRDVMRTAHPKTSDEELNVVLNWAAGREDYNEVLVNGNTAIAGFLAVNESGVTANQAADIIRGYKLPWEAVPDSLINKPEVWDALLDNVGYTALVRQLPRLARIGLTTLGSDGTNRVVSMLSNTELLQKSRIHPLSIMTALYTYRKGHGDKSKSTWTPVAKISDALEFAFYNAFGNVVPANKRTMLALDVSGSMTWGQVAGSPMTPRDASGVMAMVTARSEPDYMFMGFATQFMPLDITAKDSMTSVINKISGLPFGGTDCSLPMTWALKNKVPVDTFVVYTDSETWGGSIHAHVALRKYAEQTGINARLAVVGMVGNNFTIAEAGNPNMLDVVGFDTATPDLISGFSRGEF